MKIALCCRAAFFPRLPEVKKNLEELGFEVILPSMLDKKKLKETHGEEYFAKIHYDLIKDHFKKMENADAILVLNWDNEDSKNYIGGNVLIEMGKACDLGLPIFLLNPVPDVNYREEILAMQPIIINQDLSKIKIDEESINQAYPHPTVSGVIVNNEGEVFMMKSPKWGSGKLWTPPGGHIELGEDWEDGVKREIKEEVGLDVDVLKTLRVQQAVFPKDFWRKKHFIFITFLCKAKNKDVKLDEKEATEYTWSDPKKALEMELTPYFRDDIKTYLNEK